MHEKVIDDTKKDNLAQWLRRDLSLYKSNPFRLFLVEKPEQTYSYNMGFLIYWDYILNLIKEFSEVQLVYGIYNKGLTLFEPRLVPLTETMDTTHPSFAQVVFNINHLVRDVEPHPDILLIFEIQVPAYQVPNTAKKSALSDNRIHNGYLLSRYER